MQLAKARPHPSVSGTGRLPGVSNYLCGRDPRKWRRNVPHYAGVRYQGVYPGIDWVFYGGGSQVEYDFVVAPGADPDQIRLRFEGDLRARDEHPAEVDGAGDLVLHTSGGDLLQGKPALYQVVDGRRQPVAGGYALCDPSTVGFRVGPYDRRAPLFIDPIVGLDFSTFLGGSGGASLNDLALDPAGNIYVTGTAGPDFPVPDPDQPHTEPLRYADAFVSKFSPDGSTLLYTTFLGGRNYDWARAIAVGNDGSASIAGLTTSPDFPVQGAVQRVMGSSSDGFVTRLSADGSTIIFSTYLGGRGEDDISSIAVGPDGRIAVAGSTNSTSFPATNPPPPGLNGFVAQFTPNGSRLTYSLYLGGSANDGCRGIAVDRQGAVYVTGITTSVDYPTTPAAFQMARAKPPTPQVFVTKVKPDGTGLAYSTYVGLGNASDIAVDGEGNAYLTGIALYTFPATPGSFSMQYHGHPPSFVTKLNPLGSRVIYSTYLGGEYTDEAASIAVGPDGCAYVTGSTTSPNFPVWEAVQPRPGDPPTQGWVHEAFVTKLSPDGSRLVYSTYLGGRSGENGAAVAVDPHGAAYVCGNTGSEDFPLAKPFQSRLRGGGGFITRINPAPLGVPADVTLAPGSGSAMQVTWRDMSSRDTGFQIERQPAGGAFRRIGAVRANITTFTDPDAPADQSFTYRVRTVSGLDVSWYSNTATTVRGPGGLSVTVSPSLDNILSWTDNSSNETGFTVERKIGSGSFTLIATLPSGTTNFADPASRSATDGAFWLYRVRAFNEHAVSRYSNEASVLPRLPGLAPGSP
jgi:sugar lactone lactonase YvrE